MVGNVMVGTQGPAETLQQWINFLLMFLISFFFFLLFKDLRRFSVKGGKIGRDSASKQVVPLRSVTFRSQTVALYCGAAEMLLLPTFFLLSLSPRTRRSGTSRETPSERWWRLIVEGLV